MLTIGPLMLPSPCLLAPLAGVSDLPFRTIARSFGCGLAFAEMISANGLVHGNKKTEKLLSTSPADRPLGIQLAGADPGTIGRAVEKLRGRSFDLLDINAACPVRKVVRRGEGASLLKEPACLAAILAEAVKRATVPVTVKLRTGWDHTSRNAREIGRLAEDAGVAAIFIHGRTRAQGYSGDVDYAAIREVKNAVRVPVIASGDGLSPRLVKKLFDDTGCDGVAIARGAMGNPWIFREAAQFLRDGTVPPRPTREELTATMTAHFDLCEEYYGGKLAPKVFRKFFSCYTRGLPGAKSLRQSAFGARTREETLEIIAALRSLGG